jgi:uncharacterized heparinase superfamily protein
VGDLLGMISRGLRKPPSYIFERVQQEAGKFVDRWAAPRRARLSERGMLSLLESPDLDTAWSALMARPYPFLPEKVSIETLRAVAPGEVERILADAELAASHRIDILGSGPIDLGPEIDWHRDFKTGRRWPPAYCHRIEYSNLTEPSDVKSPWELSRLQWLIPAGQAWRLTGDERHAQTVRELIEQWIDANPYAGSVNWSCTMEAALRILTFTWFMRACGDSEAWADRAFRLKFLRSLVLHTEFTDRYIERSDVNGNHYTADATGLVFGGLFLGEGAQARAWADEGWRVLEEEARIQIFPDGVDFEASVPYHRLVAELFVLPAIYGLRMGRRISDIWRERMSAMARFTAAYARNDGTVPVWGDADDARSLPMAGRGLDDHRYLLALVGEGLGDPEALAAFHGPVSELYWMLAPDTAARLSGREPPAKRSSEAFEDGGFYVLAGEGDHVFIDCGPLGLADRGGHGHNDLLSLEASLLGHRLIVDPGCYVYTASPLERNAFRSTAYHNTPQIAGEEINRFIRPDYLWTLHNDAAPEVREWSPGEAVSRIVMSHSGYERLSPPARPVRTVSLDHLTHMLTIDDMIEAGSHAVTIPLHLAPEVLVERAADGSVSLRAGGETFSVAWSGEGWRLDVQPARIAPSYGRVIESHKLVWSHDGGATNVALTVTVAPIRSSGR